MSDNPKLIRIWKCEKCGRIYQNEVPKYKDEDANYRAAVLCCGGQI